MPNDGYKERNLTLTEADEYSSEAETNFKGHIDGLSRTGIWTSYICFPMEFRTQQLHTSKCTTYMYLIEEENFDCGLTDLVRSK